VPTAHELPKMNTSKAVFGTISVQPIDKYRII